MFQNNFPPHLHRFPLAKPIEEFKAFNLEIALFFGNPFIKFDELGWLAIHIITESLFANGVILLGKTSLNVFIAIIVDNPKIIRVI